MDCYSKIFVPLKKMCGAGMVHDTNMQQIFSALKKNILWNSSLYTQEEHLKIINLLPKIC